VGSRHGQTKVFVSPRSRITLAKFPMHTGSKTIYERGKQSSMLRWPAAYGHTNITPPGSWTIRHGARTAGSVFTNPCDHRPQLPGLAYPTVAASTRKALTRFFAEWADGPNQKKLLWATNEHDATRIKKHSKRCLVFISVDSLFIRCPRFCSWPRQAKSGRVTVGEKNRLLPTRLFCLSSGVCIFGDHQISRGKLLQNVRRWGPIRGGGGTGRSCFQAGEGGRGLQLPCSPPRSRAGSFGPRAKHKASPYSIAAVSGEKATFGVEWDHASSGRRRARPSVRLFGRSRRVGSFAEKPVRGHPRRMGGSCRGRPGGGVKSA